MYAYIYIHTYIYKMQPGEFIYCCVYGFLLLFVCLCVHLFYDTDHLGLSNHLEGSSLEKTNSSSLHSF